MFLNIFKHLLPNARAWRITTNKQLRRFFDGLGNSSIATNVKVFFDGVFTDIDPQQTRELQLWENQFGLPNTITNEQERRDRLDATWKALGGQDPRYIQDTLQNAGFDVYVHEWWIPGTEPTIGVKSCATAKNPFLVLNDGLQLLQYLACDGGVDMQDGDTVVAMDGATVQPTGYVLVNKIVGEFTSLINDGAPDMQDGDALAMDSALLSYADKLYEIPVDVSTHSYFLYIGGANYPDHAMIDQSRQNEFETLCLKICPAQQWLGMLITYS